MDHHHANGPHRVDLVVYPGFKALEAVGPMSVFDYANVHLRQQGRPDGYAVRVVAAQAGAVPSDTLMALNATHTLAELEQGGAGCTVILVGSRNIEQVLAASPELVAWAASVAPRVDRMIALCSGSFFLAAAGLLDGRRAATHWSVAALLRQRYPAIEVDPDAIYVRDGPLWTSAGVTAGIDLALALVEADLGRPMALAVARRLVMFMRRPGGQAQFSALLAPETRHAPRLAALLEWIPSQLGGDLSLDALAGQACMPPRTLTRVFQRELGTTPGRYVERVRVEAASTLLAQAQASVATVARLCGFEHPENLRRSFHKHRAVSPQAYAQRFGAGALLD